MSSSTEDLIITRWLCGLGEVVTQYQPLAELESEKVTTDVPSPVTGIVVAFHAGVGDVVEYGDATPLLSIRPLRDDIVR